MTHEIEISSEGEVDRDELERLALIYRVDTRRPTSKLVEALEEVGVDLDQGVDRLG